MQFQEVSGLTLGSIGVHMIHFRELQGWIALIVRTDIFRVFFFFNFKFRHALTASVSALTILN